MNQIHKFESLIIKNSSDINLICQNILQNNSFVNVISHFYLNDKILQKIIKLAKLNMIEYKMQLEMYEMQFLNICKELEIQHDFIIDKFKTIANIIQAVFITSDCSTLIEQKVLNIAGCLPSLIVYKFLSKTHSNFNYVEIENLNSFDFDKIQKEKINIINDFYNQTEDLSSTIATKYFTKDTKITIWTNCDGVFTADPKIVKNPIQIKSMLYKEMAELNYFSNKIIDISMFNDAVQNQIPINIRSLYNLLNLGTVISSQTDESMIIKGVVKTDGITLFSVNGFNMVGVSGFSKRVFSAINDSNINIVFIAQSSSEISICFGVLSCSEQQVFEALNKEFYKEIKQNLMSFNIKKNQSIISVCGSGMVNTPGISGKIFSNIGKANININAISQDFAETNISFAVNDDLCDTAIRLIHSSIFENKQINCIIAGNGVVGSAVINMINSQKSYFKTKGIDINIIAVFNSTKLTIQDHEMYYNSFDEIIKNVKKLVSINMVLVDCTSSDKLVESYQKFIEDGFHIVTPNKKANTMSMSSFLKLRDCFIKNKKHFFYEANVGAGLPIISTIKDLIDCGDEIIKIEGIFSGTLSYIFNNLDETKTFSQIVLDAKQKGFTEPDPKDDLCGIDVARKLLILSRMIGGKIDLEDIKIQSLVDLSDNDLKNIQLEAKKNNQVLRYVGVIENSNNSDFKVFAKIIPVLQTAPLASTNYTDNIISITTKFYNNTPLVIKGPGAGSNVTAIGVVSDLIKLSHLI
jgi:aspartokinase/homoserine dehydrogenase 1